MILNDSFKNKQILFYDTNNFLWIYYADYCFCPVVPGQRKPVLITFVFCLPESFNTNISHQLFDYKITFVNSQHESSQIPKVILCSKTRFKRLF